MNILPLILALPLPLDVDPTDAGPASDEPSGGSLSRAAEGAPFCGLGRAFHSGRRAELARRLESGVLVVRGLPGTRAYAEFRQDKTFWYLTGVESPDAALVVDLDAGREVLFLPEGSRMFKFTETWEGELWDTADDYASELTGIDEVRPIDDLLGTLDQLLEGGDRPVWLSSQPHVGLAGCFDKAGPYDRKRAEDPLDGRISREQALENALAGRYGVEVRDARPHLDAMRLVKTVEEVDAIRRASRAGAEAMNEAMRSTRAGIGEWELDALMSFVQAREGADGPAYYAIVGSGPNSCALHYNANNRRLGEGEVVLIDFGPELDHYVTDITRTWPVDGEFTPRMAELYDAVLASQLAGIAAVRPGETIGSVSQASREALRERGLLSLLPHGICHWVGMEVHDVGDYQTVLEPGMVFTIEPGLYEPETGIGVRIEDVVVVTEDGCEVLSAGCPKARAAVQALVAEPGILDLLDR